MLSKLAVEIDLSWSSTTILDGWWGLGGWRSDKTKLILISTLVEVVVEVELGKKDFVSSSQHVAEQIGRIG